ncbi:MAG TPA: biotin--[acetyl-CoA-carboxylase] ligase [Candidatus Aminicenantes bacterium]|nr:biotin--[acetyl-CoA-carboxylase] ligase [Candidatus Aminicenantes bacterium]
MKPKVAGIRCVHLATCPSTQDYLSNHLDEWLPRLPVCVTADHQSGGRGRENRSWHSPPGLGLYLSWGFRLRQKKSLPWVPLAVGVVVAELLETYCGKRTVRLKWPNDVLIKGRKVAGILSESRLTPEGAICICGIGINLNHLETDFPPDLAQSATSMRLSCNRYPSPETLLTLTLNRLTGVVDDLEKQRIRGLRARVRRFTSWMRSGNMEFHQGKNRHQGRFKGIATDGGMILVTKKGKKMIFYSGEVEMTDPGNNSTTHR